MKVCNACGAEKPLSEFCVARENKDRLTSKCKICLRADAKERRALNLDRDRASSLAWYYANKEKAAEQNKEWRRNNPDRRKEHSRKSYLKCRDLEKIREDCRLRRAADPERHRKYCGNWREKNRDRHRKMILEWMKKNPDRVHAAGTARRARKKSTDDGTVTAEAWADLKKKHKNCCAYCGGKSKSLTMDHIKPLSAGGAHSISNITPACKSCNSRKNTKAASDFVQKAFGRLL